MQCSLFWLLVASSAACGSGYKAQRLSDGGYRVKCVDHVERCLREAQRVCGKEGYRVLGGHRETKLYGGDTGYQTGAELHTLEFRCGTQPPPSKPAPAPKANKPTAERAPKSASACTPGATQKCYGAGACEGGQRCNDQGTGFLPCDCGHTPGVEGAAEDQPQQAPGDDGSPEPSE